MSPALAGRVFTIWATISCHFYLSNSPSCTVSILFFFFRLFDMNHFKSLNWIYYSIASVLCLVFFGLEACGTLTFWPGIEPTHPALEGEVLTTGLPGKSPQWTFLMVLSHQSCSLMTKRWTCHLSQINRTLLSGDVTLELHDSWERLKLVYRHSGSCRRQSTGSYAVGPTLLWVVSFQLLPRPPPTS